MGHICKELPIHADTFKCTQKSPFCPYVFRLLSASQLPRWKNRHSELGAGIDCCYNSKLQTLLWGVISGSTQRHMCTPAVLDTEMSSLRSCMGSLCLAALCQQLYQPLGSTWLVLFNELCSLIQTFRARGHSVTLLGLHLLFLHRDGAGLKG